MCLDWVCRLIWLGYSFSYFFYFYNLKKKCIAYDGVSSSRGNPVHLTGRWNRVLSVLKLTNQVPNPSPDAGRGTDRRSGGFLIGLHQGHDAAIPLQLLQVGDVGQHAQLRVPLDHQLLKEGSGVGVDVSGLAEHQFARQHLQEEAEGWGQLPTPVGPLQEFGGDLAHVRIHLVLECRHGWSGCRGVLWNK